MTLKLKRKINGHMSRKRNDWKPETRSLLQSLIQAGFTLASTDNGENRERFTTIEKAIEELTATDESKLYVFPPGEPNRELGLFLVYGNSPGELVCDYHEHSLLDAVVSKHSAAWENRKQPTIDVGET
jgi:hypothetical protein